MFCNWDRQIQPLALIKLRFVGFKKTFLSADLCFYTEINLILLSLEKLQSDTDNKCESSDIKLKAPIKKNRVKKHVLKGIKQEAIYKWRSFCFLFDLMSADNLHSLSCFQQVKFASPACVLDRSQLELNISLSASAAQHKPCEGRANSSILVCLSSKAQRDTNLSSRTIWSSLKFLSFWCPSFNIFFILCFSPCSEF